MILEEASAIISDANKSLTRAKKSFGVLYEEELL